MGLLIDTSVVIAWERARSLPDNLAPFFEQPVWFAAITVSELLHGVHRANTQARRERRGQFVERLLVTDSVLPFDTEVARTHAALWADLAREGRVIGAHDLLIAATALHHEADVLTANRRDFERVPGLKLVLFPQTTR